MSDPDLCYLSATRALEMFRTKELSPVELLDAQIARAEQIEPKINAFTYTFYEQAREQAQKAEAKYAKGGRTRALEGLAIGIKDETLIKGYPTSNGSLTMKDFIADTTSPVNEHILRAGAIVHARTATPEFSCSTVTHSRLWGVTRNPWNTEFSPGGSSGGAAASLSAGTSSLCTGSDIGGSIRIPASACGLAGFKPTYGRNPEDPPFNLDFYAHTGPLARSVADVILLQNVMCGPHPADIVSIRPKLKIPTVVKSIKGWKIAYSPNLGAFEVDPEVRKNTEAALDVFRDLGAEVEEVDLPWGPEIIDAALAYLRHLFGASLAPTLESSADLLTTYARDFAQSGQGSTPADFAQSLDVAVKMYASLSPVLERCRVLICPTTAIPSLKADHDQSRDSVSINGVSVDPFLGWALTAPFNTLSRCPVISVPSGISHSGVPTGIQIVGQSYRDVDVLQAALAYEAAQGQWFEAHRPVI